MDDLFSLAEKLGQTLFQQRWMLTTAESCTGGWIGQAVTAVPGSSNWFERGFITYSNVAKQEMLGVPKEFIQEHGAVSEAVVTAMAQGAVTHSHAQVSIAVSGIAGPDSDATDKPVGLIWLAAQLPEQSTHSKQLSLLGDRQQIRHQAVATALAWLNDLISAR